VDSVSAEIDGIADTDDSDTPGSPRRYTLLGPRNYHRRGVESHRRGVESKISGTDGKNYQSSKPPSKPRPRRPLPDAWSAAVRDLDKAVEKLDRLTADDRFGLNRGNLHGKNDIIRARNLLDKLISVLDGDPTLPGIAK
jgi:hypothetical protein